ncbi:M24 family metallopeptidase [Shouchella shacheensis]|uniref:M24 family metallopeptidase n=1 Tax=Shouchella shacheensis TaxID=1649580 RepID=UPI00073FB5CF|nr:Xaa-Pro peptidase family protein [Shouchella shacheensis]
MNAERLHVFQQKIANENGTFAFVQSKENLFYLTGFRTDPHERLIGLFVFPEDVFLIAPKMEEELVRAVGFNEKVVTYSDAENPWQKIAHVVNKKTLVGDTVFLEERTVPYARVLELQKLQPSAHINDCESMLMNQRLLKSADERSSMRRAATLADEGVRAGVNALKNGVTELEVIAKIEYDLRKQGVREMSFNTLVLFGENAASPHGVPGERTLAPGEAVLFDLGVVFAGYCSDITRTVFYGEPSTKMRTIYETVLGAQRAALAISKPGTVLGQIDAAARSVIKEAGYGDYFPHRVGHGLGVDVHEFPSLNETNTDRLQAGMTYTIEPGIYVPALGGVRIEDDVLVTEESHECLTHYPKELTIVPASP